LPLDLFQPGAYARAAGGNLERPDIQKPVIRWMAWSINADNGGNGDPAVWDRCRSLWDVNGIQNFPWLHCFSLSDIDRLIAVGKQYASPVIGLNIENVNGDFTSKGISLSDIAEKLEAWTNPIHMATLCWIQNEQGWEALARCVAALEIFIDEVPACERTQDCIDHAFAEGLTKVTLMLKTKAPNTPQTYGGFFSVCHSLYTADDITPTPEAWDQWRAPTPCTKLQPPGPPELPVGATKSAREAWDRINASSVAKKWQQDNPGEWQKCQDYWSGPSGMVAPTVSTEFGKGLVELTESRRYADGTHA